MPARITRAPALADVDDCVEIAEGPAGVFILQHIVGAEFDDNEIGIISERLIDAGVTLAAGIAGIGAVPDDEVIAIRQKLALELGGESLTFRKAKAVAEAIAKNEDILGLGGRRH